MDIEISLSGDLEGAKPAFERMYSEEQNPFLNWCWINEYWMQVERQKGVRPLICTWKRNQEIIGVLPLGIWPSLAGRRVVRPLAQLKSDESGCLGEIDGAILDAVIRAVKAREGSVVWEFENVRENSSLARALEHSREIRTREVVPSFPYPYRHLGMPGRKTKAGKRIAAYRTRMSALGELTQGVIDCDASRQEALSMLPEIFHLLCRRNRTRRNSWRQSQNRDFLRRFLERASRTSMLLFWTRLDNKLIAFDLGFRRDSSFLAYMTSFEPDLAKFRPGHVNLASAFALSESLGLTIFDFSKGEDEAKKQWSDGVAGSSIWAFAARTDAISRWTVFWLGARVRTLNWIRESKWFYKARALRPNLGFLTARNKDSSSLAGTAQLLIGWPLREFEQLAQLAEYI